MSLLECPKDIDSHAQGDVKVILPGHGHVVQLAWTRMFRLRHEGDVQVGLLSTAHLARELFQLAWVHVDGDTVGVLPTLARVALDHHPLVFELVARAADDVLLVFSLWNRRATQAAYSFRSDNLCKRCFLLFTHFHVFLPQHHCLLPLRAHTSIKAEIILEEEQDVLIYVSHAVVRSRAKILFDNPKIDRLRYLEMIPWQVFL